jgi:hypothetical protein
MSREQLLSNLGTIARSGTRKFMEMMKENAKGDNNLIGQVGAGSDASGHCYVAVTLERTKEGLKNSLGLFLSHACALIHLCVRKKGVSDVLQPCGAAASPLHH